MRVVRATLCTIRNRGENADAVSSLRFHRGDIHASANQWREVASSQPGLGLLPGADLVLLHGKIWTGEPAAASVGAAKFAEALAIANGRILAVGSNAEIKPTPARIPGSLT